MHYSNLRKFSRSEAAVKNAAARRGYRGSVHCETPKTGTLGEQLAKVDIFLDARRRERDAPREILWDFSRSVVATDGENL